VADRRRWAHADLLVDATDPAPVRPRRDRPPRTGRSRVLTGPTLLQTALGGPGGQLPITTVLPTLLAELTRCGTGVLVSPPGTGKTTLVPLALADRVNGRVVVAQPRRVAARAAAARMAWSLGEEVGGTVGYAVRGERRVGPRTRGEVVTTGLLVRRLLHDPELPGTAALILDECHERHLDTDLALAFGVQTRQLLRPELVLLAASATADSGPTSRLLGGDGPPAPVVGAEAPLFEVRIRWCPPAGPVDPPHGLRVDPRLLDHVAALTRRALAETTGDVLVFLPGAGEIDQVARRLGAGDELGARVCRLHGRLSAREQDAALHPDPERRVVLATAVAESSLTVPGVRVVVDAGLARVPRLDLARGLSGLATVRQARSSARQRAGRAGRQGPGTVYRCWSQAEHQRLPEHPQPEVATADLTGFALSLAVWGEPDPAALPLPSPPAPAAMQVARQTLRSLAAIDADGRVTDHGIRLAATGVHPRLARALLAGARTVGPERAAGLVAVLADDTLAAGTDDLATAWRRLARSSTGTDPSTLRWRTERRRLRSAIPTGDARDRTDRGPGTPTDDLAAGLITALAFPERIARARPGGGYLMASGTGAQPAPGSGLTGNDWLAVAQAQRQAGAPSARIRLAAVIDEATALEAGQDLLSTVQEVRWRAGDVAARQEDRLGAIVLSTRTVADPPADLVRAALQEGLDREGLGLLRWSPTARALRARIALLHHAIGDPWPDVGDRALLARAQDWLPAARSRRDLERIDLVGVLRGLLDHRSAARLDELAPQRITVPSGASVAIGYPAEQVEDPQPPVLAVKLQEVFGWRAVPRIAAGAVPLQLHLLSPAGRPLAVTTDLESFWQNAYPQVRAQMRGRYPKHPWPPDPLTATATARTSNATRR